MPRVFDDFSSSLPFSLAASRAEPVGVGGVWPAGELLAACLAVVGAAGVTELRDVVVRGVGLIVGGAYLRFSSVHNMIIPQPIARLPEYVKLIEKRLSRAQVPLALGI